MLVDGILAFLVSVNTSFHALHHGSPLAQSILLIGTLSLVARRRAPALVLVLAATSLVVYAQFGGGFVPLPFALLIALHALAWKYPLRISLVGACVGAGAVVAAGAMSQGAADDEVLDRLPLVAAAWLIGYGARLGRARTELVEEQTAQLRLQHETRTRLAVVEEQARIARELHDIVAHHLTVIVAQATAAARSCPAATDVSGKDRGRPASARDCDHHHQVLHAVAASGREALGDLRRLLGALSPEAELPTGALWPRLERVRGLIDHVGRSGLPVRLIVRGRPRPLPDSVEMGAYRIIQEALTNALKHAGPAKAEVELNYEPDQLGLRISDDGAGGMAGTSAASHGLLGMMQRTAALGGRISIGPAHERGFQVSAQLPVDEG